MIRVLRMRRLQMDLPRIEPMVDPRMTSISLRKYLNRRPTVVIVDDDEDLSKRVYQILLEREGYRVITARSGAAGLNLLRNQAALPDLVLVDCSMPQMDGETFVLGLRKLLPRIFIESKVVGFTSHDRRSPCFQKIKDLGIDCREKPFDMQGILQLVSECLGIPTQCAHTEPKLLKMNSG